MQGCFAVVRDQARISMPHSSERLVALLALRGCALTRDGVASSLWSQAPGDRGAAALRTALWRLGSSAARGLVTTRGHDLVLGDDVDIDFWTTARRAQDVIAGRADDVNSTDVALLRDAGDLLPDWYEDWVIIERERFRELRVEALERICGQLSALGHYGDAVQAGLAGVAAEPLRESAHQVLIAAHLAEGNRADALRQYKLLRELLRRDLDVEPSPTLRRRFDPLTGDVAVTPARYTARDARSEFPARRSGRFARLGRGGVAGGAGAPDNGE
jgi:DNA-binding SARP family transcriptional activator